MLLPFCFKSIDAATALDTNHKLLWSTVSLDTELG